MKHKVKVTILDKNYIPNSSSSTVPSPIPVPVPATTSATSTSSNGMKKGIPSGTWASIRW